MVYDPERGCVRRMRSNPVFHAEEPFEQEMREPTTSPAGWYHWDETWTFAHGPFDTEQEAEEACREYARNL